MITKFNYYYHPYASNKWWVDNWPLDIVNGFHENEGDSLSPSYYFQSESSREEEFLSACRRLKLSCLVENIEVVDNNSIIDRDYYYLPIGASVSSSQKDLINSNASCGGAEYYFCSIGLSQMSKIILDYSKLNGDFFGVEQCINPKLIVVSTKVKELFIKENISGIEFVPVLDSNENYAQDDYRFEEIISGRDDFEYYQLCILDAVLPAPKLPWVVKEDGCPRCGATTVFLSDINAVYEINSFKNKDFLKADWMGCEDGTAEFRLGVQRIVVSSKVVDLIINNKLSGLDNALCKPKVRFLPVKIRSQ